MPVYIRPQVQVFQQFRQLPQSVVANLNAFVMGPHFALYRYAVAGERTLIQSEAYAGDELVIAYPSQPQDSTIDASYTRIFMEDLWARYASINGEGTTLLNVVSTAARNKIRAAAIISNVDAASAKSGVGIEVGGCYSDGPALPETFYWVPRSGAVAGAWTRMAARSGAGGWSADNAVFGYLTKSQLHSGSIDVAAADDALTADVVIPGPFGLALDFDAGTRVAGIIDYTGLPTAGQTVTITAAAADTEIEFDADVVIEATARETYDALRHYIHSQAISGVYEVVHVYGANTATGRIYVIGNSAAPALTALASTAANATVRAVAAFTAVRSPREITFVAGSSLLTIDVADSAIPGIVDAAVEDSELLTFSYSIGSGTGTTATITDSAVEVVIDLGSSTLGDVRDALVGDAEIADIFNIPELNAEARDAVITAVVDDSAVAITADVAVDVVPDAYRVEVTANDLVFATGNGVDNSVEFLSRGVRVGDRVDYSVLGDDEVVHTGSTTVVGLEAEQVAAAVLVPTNADSNAASDVGDVLTPHTGLDIWTPGADNQRMFDGASSGIYALSPDVTAFPGQYSLGVVDDIYTITITTSGAAGTARARITTASGAYSRSDARILPLHWDETDADKKAMLYLGNNLWAVLDGSDDVDAEFKAGDTYTFSRALLAPWRSLTASEVQSSGTYTGSRDTTYVVEVVRGGAFTRGSDVIDGMLNPNRAVITFTGQPTAGDTLEIGGILFEFDAASPEAVDVNIEGTAQGSYENLLAAINEQALDAYASLDTGELVIRGPHSVISTAAAAIDNATLEVFGAELKASVDWENGAWSSGDTDDEYIVLCSQGGTLAQARFSVTSLRGDNATSVVFSAYGSSGASDIGAAGVSAYFDHTGISTPTFVTGQFWVIKVNAARPRVRITDVAGADLSSTVVVAAGTTISLGSRGAEITFSANLNNEAGFIAGGGLLRGERYYVECKAESEGALTTLILADDLPDAVTPGLVVTQTLGGAVSEPNYAPAAVSIELFLGHASIEIPAERAGTVAEYNWTADAAAVTVADGMTIEDEDLYDDDGNHPGLPVVDGTLFVQYRALLQAYSNGIFSLSSLADVSTELGVVSPDNPLAQGVYNALLNSGNRAVYFAAVPTNDVSGYTAVLQLAEKTNLVYGLVPLTRDTAIIEAVASHINAMSQPSEKRWRIGFISSDLPAQTVVVSDALTLRDCRAVVAGTSLTASVSESFTSLVRAGDYVRINFATDAFGNETYESVRIAAVVSNTKLTLAAALDADIEIATRFEVWHPNTATEMANKLRDLASGFASRRLYHIFPTTAYSAGVAQTSEFIAAAVAGLSSSVAPQQGLTRVELLGFDDLPMTYRTFSASQLDVIASGGNLIVAQDSAGAKVYVRHEISTAYSDGDVKTSELLVTKNFDAVSYYLADVSEIFVGRYNSTPEVLELIRTALKNALNFLGSSQTSVGSLGPMLVDSGSAIRSVAQHPTLLDHVQATIDVQLPLPINVLQLYVVA